MSSPPATSQLPPSERRKRQLLGTTGLIVMVVTILAFTALAIGIELASNRGKVFKATVTVLGPVEGSQNQVRLLFRVTNSGNRTGRPDKCEAILYNFSGERVGVGAVSLKEPIEPGASQEEPAISRKRRSRMAGRLPLSQRDTPGGKVDSTIRS
jgi:hypothetical protein